MHFRFEELFNELNLNHDAVEASVAYETAISEEAHWIPGAEQSIKELQDSYRIGVITNGLRVAQIRKAEKMNLHSWSDCYLISEIEGIAKPNPEIFQRALQSLNCDKKDCLMIGDNLKSDFQGAKNAGIDFCWIDTRNTLSSLSPNDEKPEWRLNSVAQLPDFLQSMYAENIN